MAKVPDSKVRVSRRGQHLNHASTPTHLAETQVPECSNSPTNFCVCAAEGGSWGLVYTTHVLPTNYIFKIIRDTLSDSSPSDLRE